MKETSKTTRRRFIEQHTGAFDWNGVIRGRLLDVGCGDDPHPLATATFDRPNGDANRLASYFDLMEFDCIHASQCLEHMVDPWKAVQNWLPLLAKGGCLVFTVPSWELYEGMIWPSRFNPDHKSTWSMWQKGSPAPMHVYVPEFVNWMGKQGTEVLRATLVDANYDYKVGTRRDQTFDEASCVECWIEVVARIL